MTDSADRDADQLQLQLADSLISLSLASVHEPRPAAPPRTAVLFQPACTLHRYIRTTDDSTIVERPQRIRAVKVGVAAAWARLEQLQHLGANDDDDRLDQLLQGLTLAGGNGSKKSQRGGDFKGKGRARQVLGGGGGGPFDILDSDAQLPVDHAALRYVHPKPNQPPDNDNDEGGWESASDSSSPGGAEADAGPSSKPSSAPPPWPEQLQSLCRASSSSLHPPSPSTSPRKSSTTRTTSEIPPHLSQGDLYLCPGSEPAIFGALGACCEAVDRIVAGGGGGAGVAAQQQQQTANVSEDQQDAATSYDRAFVAIRPPGHHCGEANPQGFCFVNNVAVAAAHAHIEHGIDRVVILDIDLHHGNGTQEIAWRINAEAHEILEAREQEAQRRAAAALKTPRSSPRKSSPRKMGGGMPIQKGVKEEEEEGEERKKEGKEKEAKDPLRIMYASLHDIWSYPCEDGDPTLVAAASLSLNGGHGQYISNVHLEPWNSEVDFHERLYPKYREGLIERAEDFVRLTRGADELEEEEGARGKKTLVIVSLGCDASEHESAGMSRHNRNVPTSFYRRFALDATSFAHHHAAGKCLAVLEGGYSDRALASASAAFLSGFADRVPSSANNDNDRKPTDRFTVSQERDGWWSEPHLKKLEKACSVAKTRRGGGAHSSPSVPGLLVGADGGTASATTRDPWLARAVEVFAHLEDTAVASSISSSLAPGSSGSILHSDPNTPRQLRDRTKSRPINYAALADGSSPLPSPVRGALTSTSTRPPSASNRLRGDAAPSSSEEEVSTTSLPPPVPVLPPAFASAADEAPSAAPSDPPPHPAQPVFAFTSPDSETPIHESAPSSVPAATTPEAVFGDAGEERAEESAPVKPAIRFTWKQGGFGGEPRM